MDDLGEIRGSLPGDAEQPGQEPVPGASTRDDRTGQDDEPAVLFDHAVGFGQCDRVEDIFRGEGGDDRVECGIGEGEALRKSACEMGGASRVAFGETRHLGGFVQSDGGQSTVKQDALQVSGSVTEFEDSSPFDERRRFQYPIFPPAK